MKVLSSRICFLLSLIFGFSAFATTFDPQNPPSFPDSSLNSDLTTCASFILEDSGIETICAGDWVDVDPSALDPDPNWGYSFQVMDVNPNVEPAYSTVSILITQDEGETYFATDLSASWVQNNFRRVPREGE